MLNLKEMTIGDLRKVQDDKRDVQQYFRAVYALKDAVQTIKKPSADAFIRRAQAVPHLIQGMRQELKKKYGPSLTLYRGLSWNRPSADSVWQRLGRLEKGDSCILKSWRNRAIFEWTPLQSVARDFAYESEYGLVLRAQISVAQICYAYEVFGSAGISNEFDHFDSFAHEKGFFVWHNRPVTATVIYRHGADHA